MANLENYQGKFDDCSKARAALIQALGWLEITDGPECRRLRDELKEKVVKYDKSLVSYRKIIAAFQPDDAQPPSVAAPTPAEPSNGRPLHAAIGWPGIDDDSKWVDVDAELAKQGLRRAAFDESGWYVTVTGGKLWATDQPAPSAAPFLAETGIIFVCDAYPGQPFNDHTFSAKISDLPEFVVTGIEKATDGYILHNPKYPNGLGVSPFATLTYKRIDQPQPEQRGPAATRLSVTGHSLDVLKVLTREGRSSATMLALDTKLNIKQVKAALRRLEARRYVMRVINEWQPPELGRAALAKR